MEERVLFVDDEQNVLSSIRRMLFDEMYEQYFALGGEEALAILRKTPVSVIVSDMRMPLMDGVAFLEKAREIVPDSVRIILSGHSDISSVMEAISRGGIWRFITKPWNDEDLKCTIRNALDLYRVQQERLMLFNELERKNAELKILNQELEHRVKQRTQLIEAQKKLLQKIVDGTDLSSFAVESCSVLHDLVESDEVALLHAVADQSIAHAAIVPTEYQKQALTDTFSSGKEFLNEHYLVMPVVHSSSVIGAIGVGFRENAGGNHVHEILSSMIPVVALALGQFKMIADAPGLMDDLDDLIGKL